MILDILDKESIQNLISMVEQRLNVFPYHDSQYPIEINSDEGNKLESILNFVNFYFKELLKSKELK
jgi:hypothetical protein